MKCPSKIVRMGWAVGLAGWVGWVGLAGAETGAETSVITAETNPPPTVVILTNAVAGGTGAGSVTNGTLASVLTNAPAERTNSPAAATRDPASEATRAGGSSTNTAPVTGEVPAGPVDFSTFRVVSERNIFNPNRSPRVARGGRGEARRVVRVETFKLVGTMSYDQGDLAFFDGSGAFRKTARTNDAIGGYRIVAIQTDEVKLEADGKTVLARVGTQFRREDGGPWSMAAGGTTTPATAGTESSGDGTAEAAADGSSEVSGSGAGGGVSDVLARLRQKREQEMKNEKP